MKIPAPAIAIAITCTLVLARNEPEQFDRPAAIDSTFTTNTTVYDTFKVDCAPRPHLTWNRQRSAGLTMMTVFGLLAYHYSRQAENSYQDYLVSGSVENMDRLFRETARYDRYAGLAFILAEAGLLIVVKSFNSE
ncbi:MAG: hypothetical protein ABIA75_10960 [Candidatus Neomarinimicrobiota bacterium]